MIEIGIITTPRINETLNKSIESLRQSFYDVINVYAEPGEYDIKDQGVNLKINKEKLGCFKNYHNALSDLVTRGKPHVLVLSDDFVYARNLFKKIPFNPRCGYYALFTPTGMIHPPCSLTERGWNKVNTGWKTSFGGLYLMKTEMAKRIMEHEFYQNHLNNYEKNQQIDHCIPEVCYQLGLDQWYPNPSLANHIGFSSTIGHIHSKETSGLNFRR